MRDSPPPSIIRTLLAALAVLVATTPVFAAGLGRGFNRLLESVVRIDVREITFENGAQGYTGGIGSGVIISSDGLVVTNAHVAGPQAVEISVTLANLERVGATLVGWDHWTDLAVLRLDLADLKRRRVEFSAADYGDSDDLFPGQTVYAVGTPYGLTRTVTRGIISNNRRPFEDTQGVRGYETGMFNTWLQTDAAINPGNSGGPLVDEDGKVIGINSRAYVGADNLGFAVPSNVVRQIAAQIVKDGAVTRSYLGLVPGALQDLEKFYALAANTGMLINSVDPGSPAARAGIRPGDVVLTLNGKNLDGRFPEQLPPLQNQIATLPVGSTVKLTIRRGGQTLTLSAVTEKLESRVGEEWAFDKWGLSVRKVSRAFARENQLADATGVIVVGVQPGYPAAAAGLARGDVITKVGPHPIVELQVLKMLYQAYLQKPEPQLIEAQRNRRLSLYVIKP